MELCNYLLAKRTNDGHLFPFCFFDWIKASQYGESHTNSHTHGWIDAIEWVFQRSNNDTKKLIERHDTIQSPHFYLLNLITFGVSVDVLSTSTEIWVLHYVLWLWEQVALISIWFSGTFACFRYTKVTLNWFLFGLRNKTPDKSEFISKKKSKITKHGANQTFHQFETFSSDFFLCYWTQWIQTP